MDDDTKRALLLRMHEQEIFMYSDGVIHHCYDKEEDKIIQEAALACEGFEIQTDLTEEEKARQRKLSMLFENIIVDPSIHLELNSRK